METPKSTSRGFPLIYIVGIVIAYLAGVGTPKLVQVVSSSVTPANASGQKGRGENGAVAAEEDRANGTKRHERTGNPEGRAVTTERIRSAFHLSDSTRGQLEFARLMEDADAATIAEIREMFFEFDRSGLTYDTQWRMLWHQWGSIDPEGALARITSEVGKGGEGYTPACHAWIFSAWAGKDPKAAIEALATVKSEQGYEAAYYGLISGMSLEEATRFAQTSQFSDSKFASNVAEKLADRQLRESNSVSDLKSWYGSLDPSLQGPALDHVYWRIRTVDFNDAADWIKSQAEAGTPTKRIAAEMTDEYLRRDDPTGLSWYLSLPASSQEPEKIREWANRVDPNSAAYQEWARQHPDASRRLESLRERPE